MAHDEKSKFLIFRPEIPYGGLSNVVYFFLKYFFDRHNTPLEISLAQNSYLLHFFKSRFPYPVKRQMF